MFVRHRAGDAAEQLLEASPATARLLFGEDHASAAPAQGGDDVAVLADLFVANGHIIDNIDQFSEKVEGSPLADRTYPQVNHLYRNDGEGRYDGEVQFPLNLPSLTSTTTVGKT